MDISKKLQRLDSYINKTACNLRGHRLFVKDNDGLVQNIIVTQITFINLIHNDRFFNMCRFVCKEIFVFLHNFVKKIIIKSNYVKNRRY